MGSTSGHPVRGHEALCQPGIIEWTSPDLGRPNRVSQGINAQQPALATKSFQRTSTKKVAAIGHWSYRCYPYPAGVVVSPCPLRLTDIIGLYHEAFNRVTPGFVSAQKIPSIWSALYLLAVPIVIPGIELMRPNCISCFIERDQDNMQVSQCIINCASYDESSFKQRVTAIGPTRKYTMPRICEPFLESTIAILVNEHHSNGVMAEIKIRTYAIFLCTSHDHGIGGILTDFYIEGSL